MSLADVEGLKLLVHDLGGRHVGATRYILGEMAAQNLDHFEGDLQEWVDQLVKRINDVAFVQSLTGRRGVPS